MKLYDALVAPEPEEWLALDEQERLQLIRDFHGRIRAPVPRAARETRAFTHAIIENLLAGEDGPAMHRVLERLIREGLDRHEAIHAIGCVLLNEMTDAVHGDCSFSVEN